MDEDYVETSRVYSIRIIVMNHGWTMTTTYYDTVRGTGPVMPHDYKNNCSVRADSDNIRSNCQLDTEFRIMAESLDKPGNHVEYTIDWLSPKD